MAERGAPEAWRSAEPEEKFGSRLRRWRDGGKSWRDTGALTEEVPPRKPYGGTWPRPLWEGIGRDREGLSSLKARRSQSTVVMGRRRADGGDGEKVVAKKQFHLSPNNFNTLTIIGNRKDRITFAKYFCESFIVSCCLVNLQTICSSDQMQYSS